MNLDEKLKTEIIPFLCEVRDQEVSNYIGLVNKMDQFVFVNEKIKKLVIDSSKAINRLEFTIFDYCQYSNMEMQQVEPSLKLKLVNAQKKFAAIENEKKPYICGFISTLYKNMKKLLFITLIACAFVQCTKETEQPTKEPCEVFNTGKGKIISLLPDPYLIYLDGKYIGRCGSNSTFEHDIKPDTYSFKAVQESGYVFYPTEYVSSYNVVQCQTTTLTLK